MSMRLLPRVARGCAEGHAGAGMPTPCRSIHMAARPRHARRCGGASVPVALARPRDCRPWARGADRRRRIADAELPHQGRIRRPTAIRRRARHRGLLRRSSPATAGLGSHTRCAGRGLGSGTHGRRGVLDDGGEQRGARPAALPLPPRGEGGGRAIGPRAGGRGAGDGPARAGGVGGGNPFAPPQAPGRSMPQMRP